MGSRLTEAIDSLPGRKKAWIKEARAVLKEEDVDITLVIRFISDVAELASGKPENLTAAAIKRLTGFRDSLDKLLRQGGAFRAHLNERIRSLS